MTDGESLCVGASPTSDPLATEHRKHLGNVLGRRVLDLGCGTGAWSTRLALEGAIVVSLDVSPVSLQVTLQRAKAAGLTTSIFPICASGHELPFSDGAFDLVTGQFILHHLELKRAAGEIKRVLRSGGRAVFTENSAKSGLLMLARRTLCGHFGIPKWSTPAEYPLRRQDLEILDRTFARVRVSHPRFDWFFLLNAKLFGYRHPVANRLCDWGDRVVPKLLPFMRRYAYYQVLTLDR